MSAAHEGSQRRFGGLARLYGEEGAARLASAHVLVVGVGGVGSWAAEALARSGVGCISLIDLDHVAESNINRQIHALEDTLGRAKVLAMAERIAAINPHAEVRCVEDFLSPENAAQLLAERPHVVIDAVDQARAKLAMVLECRRLGLPLVVCGAAGGKTDPGQVRVADLALSQQDPLLSRLRSRLRREHGFSRQEGKKMGLTVVYSGQPLRRPLVSGSVPSSVTNPAPDAAACAPQGLSCAGYGSSMVVTASFGLQAAAWAMERIVERRP